MATNLHSGPDSGVGELVAGIVQDAQELIGQQLALFKQEVRQDLKRARDGAGFMAAAAGACLIGSLLLVLMLVHLLNWLAPDNLPLWSCYGIVGGVLTAFGAIMAWRATHKFEHALPEKTVKALEENLEWKTKPS
jgi:hypothetical protein